MQYARHRVRGLVVLAAVMGLLLSIVGSAGATDSSEPRDNEPAWIHPDLTTSVEEAAATGDDALRAVLVLEDQADLSGVHGDRDAVVERLKETAQASQQALDEQLEAAAASSGVTVVNRLWIANMVLVAVEPSMGALESLAALEQVDRIVPNYELHAHEPAPAEATDGDAGATTVDDRTWGIDRIRAHQVWDELGLDGSGVRVAVLDTGVDIDHPDLAGKLATDDPSDPHHPGGWMEFDDTGGLIESEPHDSSDHGTHVSGTVAGGDDSGISVGVAPGADLMHGLVIPGGGGEFIQVAAGMQWAVEPTDADGNAAGEPADIVNMSLGANDYIPEMIAPTQAMRAAEIFPAFSIGNAGLFGCGVGHGSPGNVYEAVGIGMTDIEDDVAAGSCGGEADWPDEPGTEDWPDVFMKPDLSAPGVDVLSTLPGGEYGAYNGTSMAAPHVAGTVALMLQGSGGMSVDDSMDLLIEHAFWDDRHGEDRPNDRFGHGRIDAYEPVLMASMASGITGTVSDTEGEPIAGAEVAVEDRNVTTGSDGSFQVMVEPGTYDVEASAFAYEPATESGVEVVEEEFTPVEFELEAAPTGLVAGQVTLNLSGQGVPNAHVDVAGTPMSGVTDAQGEYEIDGLPEGEYEVSVSHDRFSTPASETVSVTADETTEQDFEVTAVAGDFALVTSSNGPFEDYFESLGLELSVYRAADLAQAAEHDTVLYSYEAVAPEEDDFAQFLSLTDDNGAGVLFLDHAYGTHNGLRALSDQTGQPEEYDNTTVGGSMPLYYEVVEEHPVVEGYAPGDEIEHDTTSSAPWIAWFSGYEGDNRQVIADVGRDGDGIMGEGIAVDDRDGSRHVLMSVHAHSATRGPAEWTDESEDLFWNAVDWASPEPDDEAPIFTTWGLEVDPDVVISGEDVEATVNVTNVGATEGEHTARLLLDGDEEDTETVTLEPGETTEVAWTVTAGDIGTYELSVGNEDETFRVRPPEVDLTASTLDGSDGGPAPLADADVELILDGDRTPVGTTDSDGQLTFETLEADAEYTVVVHREATDDHEYAYLLQRPERIDDDVEIELAPRTSAEMNQNWAWDQSAVVELDADAVSDDHQSITYLRSDLTDDHAYAFSPGPVVATIGMYEARHVHTVTGLERDWWYASDIVSEVDLRDPVGTTLGLGGEAEPQLNAEAGEGTEFTATWSVVDAEGTPFALAAQTELTEFVDLPTSATLEDVPDLVRGEAPEDLEVILRVNDPSNTPVYAGGVGWDDRVIERDLADLIDDPPSGNYLLELEVDFGAYGGDLEASDSLTISSGDGDGDREASAEPPGFGIGPVTDGAQQ